MAKYIDADRLRAEIISLRHFTGEKLTSFADEKYVQGIRDGRGFICNECLALIDSLQQDQPEVDINGEIHKEAMKLHTAPTYDELASFARHFYELGKNSK